ncbi:MAG: TetR/AcrR family transcriptional regulator [Planctomycetota bacterium]
MARVKTNQDRMIEAALKVFATKGYAGTSVDDIIKAAEVARGTFYLYFESKHTAFEQVLTHVIGQIEKLLQGIPSGMIFRTPEDVYNRMLTTYARFLKLFQRNRAFARIVYTEATGADKGFDALLEKHYDTHRTNIRRFLECVRQSGFARSFHIDVVTETIIGYTERCARIFIGGEAPGMDLDALARELADTEFLIVSNVPLAEVRPALPAAPDGTAH